MHTDDPRVRKERLKTNGGAASIAMNQLMGRIQSEMRCTVLGHLQRGGSPIPFDRVLATRFGVAAATLIEQERWGEMVCLRDGEIEGVSMERAIEVYRLVNPKGALMNTARGVGIEFGG